MSTHPKELLHPLGWRSVMRRPSVKRLTARLEASLAAAAFAEEREVETARQILAEPSAPDRRGSAKP